MRAQIGMFHNLKRMIRDSIYLLQVVFLDQHLELAMTSVLLVMVHQSIYLFSLLCCVVCLAGRHWFKVHLCMYLLHLLLLLEALLGKLLYTCLVVETTFWPNTSWPHAEGLQSLDLRHQSRWPSIVVILIKNRRGFWLFERQFILLLPSSWWVECLVERLKIAQSVQHVDALLRLCFLASTFLLL